MGLDQYLYLIKDDARILIRNAIPYKQPNFVLQQTGTEFKFIQNTLPPNTYRKYWALHEFVADLYYQSYPEDEEEFNQKEHPVSSSELETWFKSQDANWDTPSSVDYKNLKDEDDDLSETEFWRNFNHYVLKVAKTFEEKGFILAYSAWY